MVGFLRALALQTEELGCRVEQVVDLISYWSERHRRLPWFVVVLNHIEIVGYVPQALIRKRPTITIVSCHNATYFSMDFTPSMDSKIYYVSNDIEEMTHHQARMLAVYNRKIMSSIPTYNDLAPYTI